MVRSNRKAISLMEILVVIAIVGILVALLLPATQKVREAAQKLECANNLKQQGVALHNYHESHGCLPPSKINPPGYSYYGSDPVANQDFYQTGTYKIYGHTAFTLLLPYLEYEDIYRKYRFDYPSCDAIGPGFVDGDIAQGGIGNCPDNANEEVIGSYIRQYHCPADKMPKVDTVTNKNPAGGFRNARRTNYLVCVFDLFWENYAITPPTDTWVGLAGGVPIRQGMFRDNFCRRLIDVVDGSSNTIAIGETKQDNWRTDFTPHWGAGHIGSMTGAMRRQFNSQLPTNRINYPFGEWVNQSPSDPRYTLQNSYVYGSYHRGGANFVFGDGSVHFLRNDISFALYQALGTANGTCDGELALPDTW